MGVKTKPVDEFSAGALLSCEKKKTLWKKELFVLKVLETLV